MSKTSINVRLTDQHKCHLSNFATVTDYDVAVVADASTIADFPGVKAATFALCATTMLSLTMLPTGDRPGERDLDLVVKLASLAFAFLSGWFWLESALGDFSLRYYLLTIGILVLVVFSAVIFWPASYLALALPERSSSHPKSLTLSRASMDYKAKKSATG